MDSPAWKRRTAALIEWNSRTVTEASTQALFQAAAYPETVTAAAALLRTPDALPDGPD